MIASSPMNARKRMAGLAIAVRAAPRRCRSPFNAAAAALIRAWRLARFPAVARRQGAPTPAGLPGRRPGKKCPVRERATRVLIEGGAQLWRSKKGQVPARHMLPAGESPTGTGDGADDRRRLKSVVEERAQL